MKKLLPLLALLLLLTGCAAEPLPVPEITLAVASDLHYLSPTLTDYGPDFIDLLYRSDGKVTQYTPQLTDALVYRLQESGPDYLLLTGDLSGRYEQYAAMPADVLKVAHHGSSSATSPAFLTAVSPQTLLLSNRDEEREHRMAELAGEIPLYSTACCGAVTLTFPGDGTFTVEGFLPFTE